MFERKKRDMGGIPTSSMSDIAFLLLVFFLTTTVFDIKKGLGMTLPPHSENTDVKQKLNDENILRVWINQQSVVFIDGVPTPIPAVRGEIERRIKGHPELVVSLKTHRDAAYETMVQVLEQLQLADAEKISLSSGFQGKESP